MLTLFFGSPGHARSPTSSGSIGTRFRDVLLRRCSSAGFYLPPSPFEACFLSLAHSENDVDEAIAAADEVLRET